MSETTDRRSDIPPPLAPWARGLIAVAVILGLGGFSTIVSGQPAAQSDLQPNPTLGVSFQAGTRTPTPFRVPTPTRIRIPTRLPDSGTNENNDMCTVIASEHAARPSVPLCDAVK